MNIPSNRLPYALLGLDPTDCASFSINGGTILNVTGGVMVDSAAAKTSSPTCTSKNAATTTGGSSGNNQLNTFDGSNNVVGSGDTQGVTPAWNTGANFVVDPLSAHVPPFDGTATFSDGTYSYTTIPGQPGTPAAPALWSDNGGNSFTNPLAPGVVWGGMNVTGNLVLKGGVYIMAGGGFNVSGGTVSALNPVTFIYTDDPVCEPGCKAGDLPGSVSGTGSTTGQTTGGNGGSWGLPPGTGTGPLVAPTSGVPDYLDHILIYVDKTLGTCTGTGNTTLVVGGSGTFDFAGGTPATSSIIYAPCSTVKLYGNSGSQGGAVVAYQVTVNGGKSLTLLGPGRNGPGPSKSNLVQ